MEAASGKLHKLFDENFLEYTSYVIRERAIPAIEDGLKPVQRRILQTLFNMEDGRFHKVANVVGETMKLHPHGDASIFSALVNLANKGYLIERQGNFGNIYTGDEASAARYIECRLTPLAKEVLFNKDLTAFVDSYDGRMVEPVVLPAKIPVLLLQGAEGIAVGMATKILPHNFGELLAAQISILKGESFTLYPDFQQKGFIDVSDYQDGNGKIRCRARIEAKDDKTIKICNIPYGTTTESLTDSIEKAAKSGKIKITSINDFTAEDVEIEIKLARGIHSQETIDALYAFTDCEISISPNLTIIKGANPETSTVSEVIRYNTEKLVADLTRQLEIELGRLMEKLHARKLEQIFIEERLYKNIEEQTSFPAVLDSVKKSLIPFASELHRPVTTEDVEHLLEIRIKRISRFDIERQQREIRDIQKEIQAIKKSLKDMVGYTIAYLDGLIENFARFYPRQTEIIEFTEVSARAVAVSNLTVAYHRATGFLGQNIKQENTQDLSSIACSEYDKLFLIFKDGRYKVIPVVEKLFVGNDLEWYGKVDKDMIFSLLYRDGAENLVYMKKFKTPSFILDKEYQLFPTHDRSKILLLLTGEHKRVKITLEPSSRAKSNTLEIDFDEILVKGASAIGKRVSNRKVRKVVELASDSPKTEAKMTLALPGMESEKNENGEGEVAHPHDTEPPGDDTAM